MKTDGKIIFDTTKNTNSSTENSNANKIEITDNENKVVVLNELKNKLSEPIKFHNNQDHETFVFDFSYGFLSSRMDDGLVLTFSFYDNVGNFINSIKHDMVQDSKVIKGLRFIDFKRAKELI